MNHFISGFKSAFLMVTYSHRADASSISNPMFLPSLFRWVTFKSDPSGLNSTKPMPEALIKRSPRLEGIGLCGITLSDRRLVNQFNGDLGENNQRFNRSSISKSFFGNSFLMPLLVICHIFDDCLLPRHSM